VNDFPSAQCACRGRRREQRDTDPAAALEQKPVELELGKCATGDIQEMTQKQDRVLRLEGPF
jgi:hypothetical protein